MSKGRIMVVDDDQISLSALILLLQMAGYKVTPILSGQEAISAATLEPPDMFLLDIMMPKMDGFQACAELKSRELLCHIPVIFLTCRDEIDYRLQGFRAGAVDYITKPFLAEEVLARVEAHLARYRERSQLRRQVVEARQLRDLERSVGNAEKNLLRMELQLKDITP